MFSLPKFSIKRPVCILICIVSLVTFGISSIFEMPLESTPEIEMPVLMVMTQYPGASPEEVDKMVTDRVEAAIANVSEVDSTQSVSSEGVSMVVMMFEYSADIDKKYQDVSSALALVPLPDDCTDPVLIEVNTSNLNNSIMSLSIKAEANDNVKAYVEDNVVPEIEKIEGVSDVSVSGGSRKYVQVLLDENKLSQYKITMQQVVSAIATAEYEVTLGDLDRGNVTVGLIGSKEFTEYHSLEDVPITLSSGDIIHVSDVAQVNLADEEISSYYRQDGKETIGISVAKNQIANTVDICNQVLKVVDNLNSQQLGLEIEVTSNSGEDIMENIRSVASALVEGLAIAVVVLWVFLGEWKASLIVGLSMPFSVLATLILMSFFGMTINLISLGGLVIGIGMLVDNSIVVIDSCFKAQAGERSFEENVIKGAELVLGSIVASTLTTIVVFLPIGMMQGMSGQLFHDICYTIVFSLTASLVSALTLVPLLFVRLKPVERKDFSFARAVRRLEERYGQLMRKLLDKRALVVVTAIVLFVAALGMYSQIDMELMPAMENGRISMSVDVKNGLNLESTSKIMTQIEDIVKKEPDVETYSMSVGGGSGLASMMGSGSGGSISLKLKDDASMTSDEFVQRMRDLTAGIPNCSVEVSKQNMMSIGTGDSIQLTLQGKNLTSLKEQAELVREELVKMPEFQTASTSLSDGSPRAKIEVDPILAGSVGMTPSSVLANARSKISGSQAMTLQQGDTEYSVMVEYDPERFQDISDLYGLMIDTPRGGQVALTDVATITYSTAPSSIMRMDGEYLVTVTATPPAGSNINNMTRLAIQQVQKMGLPEGIKLGEGSNMEMMYEEFAAIGRALVIAIYLVFAVMAIQFESLRFSLVVLMSVPFALTGSFFALLLTGSSINMASLLGVVMLVGIVVNNAIVLIDYANILRRDEGMEIRDALVMAGKSRLRPILMSTLTTVVGLVPMAFGSGVEMMESMAVVVIGGLLFSTLLTLILIPTLYLIFDKEDRKSRKQQKRQKKLEAAAK